ncbi:MAG: hypothetical protein CK425_05330 [Parachlamydia sp.]|nr:MAG: hypothetical protein CK425_05330 [Parachlamydia sp.]
MIHSVSLKKRSFATLLEVLIALSLTTIILTTLSYFYLQIDSLNRASERVQLESFKRRFLQYRLTQIMPKTLSFKGKNREGLSFFFSTTFSEGLFLQGTESLVFAYDNCVNLDSTFAAEVLARLYVDLEGRFCLGIWPAPKRWPADEMPPMKKEILFEGVEMLKFQFFIPPDKGELKFLKKPKASSPKGQQPGKKPVEKQPPSVPLLEDLTAVEPGPKGSWVDVWQKEYNQSPAIVRIILTPKGSKQPLIYVFPLPNCQRPIIYDQ